MSRFKYYLKEGFSSIFTHSLMSFTTVCVMIASHCVMSGPASERVQESALTEIVFTDSIPYTQRCAKVKQISVADMFAETIRRVINNESISDQYLV